MGAVDGRLEERGGHRALFARPAIARSSPRARADAHQRVDPACVHDRLWTSAKSRLIRPGVVIRSVMPCNALEQDVIGESERLEHTEVLTRQRPDSRRSLGMTMSVSTSATCRSRRRPDLGLGSRGGDPRRRTDG